LFLGLWAAEALKEWRVLGEIDRLASHPNADVARVAGKTRAGLRSEPAMAVAERLTAERRAAPDRSALFRHLGDAEIRRQVLRWFARDFSELTPRIDEALRAGSADPDEEVRVTARLVRERLTAKSSAASEPFDDRSLLEYALVTPLSPAPGPTSVPGAIELTKSGEYRLRRSGVVLCWVGPVEHWLGEGRALRKVRSPGLFVAREPVTSALAEWAQRPTQGPLGAANARAARVHLCAREEALAIGEALTRIEGVGVTLPSPDEWEMAARGTDGRRFPWGNRDDVADKNAASPWGCWRMVGGAPEWTLSDVVCGGPRAIPCARRRPARDVTHAAARIVVKAS
jgi:hypothetical protein